MSRDCREDFVKRIRERIGAELDPAAAKVAVEAVIRELSNYEITPRSTALAVADGTNEKLLKRYIACLRIDGKSEKTIAQYARECRKFAEATGRPYTETGPYDIRFYLANMKGRGISNRSMENSRMYLSAFFRWMELEELIPRNPCATVKKSSTRQTSSCRLMTRRLISSGQHAGRRRRGRSSRCCSPPGSESRSCATSM